MKISKRQLKQIIREERARFMVEGNHAVDYAIGYEDARDGLPQNSDDPWYSAGYADFLEGIHDQYEALHQDGVTTPPAMKESKMKISKRRLRKIIKEEYARLLKENQGHEEMAAEVYAEALKKGMSPQEAGELAAEAYNTGNWPF